MRSPDGGLTWSERLPVPENWATSQEVPTLFRMEDGEGTRRLILFSGLYPIRRAVSEDDEIMVVTNRGMMIRTAVKQISTMSRSTQGVRIISMSDDDERVASVARIAESDDDE